MFYFNKVFPKKKVSKYIFKEIKSNVLFLLNDPKTPPYSS